MKIWLKRIGIALAVTAAVLTLLITGLVVNATHTYDKTWDVPLPDTRAVYEPDIVARGKYLVYGPAHCADCHAPDEAKSQMFRGEIVPLTGGTGEITFLGDWTAPNLTSDTVTGIGAMSDGELARVLRTGVNREGRIALPFKDTYADMAESDLVAIISYLRTLPPEPGVGPRKDINILGMITLAYFLEPYGPKEDPRGDFPPEATAAYGDYLANVVGRCESCHTPRNLKTGAFLGAPLSGGMPFQSRGNPGTVYVSPNLTPDSATGHITHWDEEFFVARMRAGAKLDDSPMPWGSYRRMTDVDLRALYRYLHSLDPVYRDNGPMIQSESEFAGRANP